MKSEQRKNTEKNGNKRIFCEFFLDFPTLSVANGSGLWLHGMYAVEQPKYHRTEIFVSPQWYSCTNAVVLFGYCAA